MNTTEYEIPLGSRKALLIIKSLNSAQLILNGVDCESGEENAAEPAKHSFMFSSEKIWQNNTLN